MNTQIISTFYNSYNDESHQNILDFNLSKEQLNKYTLKEYAEHINDWIHTDNDIVKMSFCFECTPLESKKYKMTKDLLLKCCLRFFKEGNSFRHQPHHVVQKDRSTTFPRYWARLIVPCDKERSSKAGALQVSFIVCIDNTSINSAIPSSAATVSLYVSFCCLEGIFSCWDSSFQ